MASKDECDQYAAELTRRFDEMVQWALMNWPTPAYPLLSSDFSEARREIAHIIGSKLGEGEAADNAIPGEAPDAPPFVNMNPMPWP